MGGKKKKEKRHRINAQNFQEGKKDRDEFDDLESDEIRMKKSFFYNFVPVWFSTHLDLEAWGVRCCETD